MLLDSAGAKCQIRSMRRLSWFFLVCLLGCSADVFPNRPPSEPTPDALNSTHEIYMDDPSGGSVRCSSVAVSETNLLTAKHCVEGRQNVRVNIAGKVKPAEVVHMSEDRDMAEIRLVRDVMGHWVDLGPEPRPGQAVTFMGYGCTGRLMISRTSVIGRIGNQVTAYPAVLCRGDSGGPLFDEDFDLVGIANSMSTSVLGTINKFAIIE